MFALVDRCCFHGHSHIPGLFLMQDGEYRYMSVDEFGYALPHPAGKMMCNVGSVGQPRDGDPRACYVILTDEAVLVRRVEYPFRETMHKIHGIPELDGIQADRLAIGR